MKGFFRALGSERGFSLLELLIVMSIIGVLATVAIPRFSNAIILANTARVQSDLHVLNSAIVLFQAENGSYPSNLTTDMNEYIQDAENLKPPKGKCRLRDGSTIDITDTAYTLSSDRTQALCQSHPISDFGKKE